jgi:hypothetical protein
MKRKKTLATTTPLLFILGLLTINLVGVSAVPSVSPYIMVVPENTLDTNLIPDMNYEVSIVTDYDGTDVWSWQFSLTFNATVLEGISVSNGDLITQEKNPAAYFMFAPGTFNNTAGTLSLTSAYYDFVGPNYDTTYGPGILANVTFRVKDYGSSDITLVTTPSTDTVLIGATGSHTHTIISGYVAPEKIGNGYFSNKLLGDVNGNRKVDAIDLFAVGKAYSSAPSKPNWNPECDFNRDNNVNKTDLTSLGNNYGKSI